MSFCGCFHEVTSLVGDWAVSVGVFSSVFIFSLYKSKTTEGEKSHFLSTLSSLSSSRPPHLCLHWVFSMLDAALARREGQDGHTDRADKSFSCGQLVWGLAFGPRPPKSAAAASRLAKTSPKGKDDLLLATGLENGVIKIWNVLTGEDARPAVCRNNCRALIEFLPGSVCRECCVWSPWPRGGRQGPSFSPEWVPHTHLIISRQDFEDLGLGSQRFILLFILWKKRSQLCLKGTHPAKSTFFSSYIHFVVNWESRKQASWM